MKLTTIAKPVRIRIKSGNEEHGSLESLLNNFVWEDVSVLLDGRLVKWLRRIHEDEIADKIERISDPQNNFQEVYCTLFRKDKLTIDEIFEACRENSVFVPFASNIINTLPLKELLVYFERYSDISDKLPFDKRLVELAEKLSKSNSATILFQVGEYLYNGGKYVDEGERCILIAAEKGLKKAVEFKEEKLDDYWTKLRSTKIIDRLEDAWRRHAHMTPEEGITKDIVELSNACMTISDELSSFGYRNYRSDAALYREVGEYEIFQNIKSSDPLYYEKNFLRALFEPDLYAKERLKKIQDYKPAKYLYQGSFKLDDTYKVTLNSPMNSLHCFPVFFKNFLNYR